MDAMGDGDELYYDDEPTRRDQFLTPETLAIAGAGLVLMSVFSTAVFQYAAFLLFQTDGNRAQTTQYLLLAGPAGAMAALGAIFGWSAHRRPMSAGFHGVAGAAVVVGAGIALVVAATAVGGYLWGDDPTQPF